jgi:hypothetical protein
MTLLGTDCDCQILYGVREVHFRRLKNTGQVESGLSWYATDCPVSIGLDPTIEEGKSVLLKCGDSIKNTVKGDDQLTGMTVKFAMGCRNPEIEDIISGSNGVIIYDGSSPPCAIGWCAPTLADQASAVPFEMRIYVSEKSGSNDVGYEEIHVYQCLPSYPTIGSSQEEYQTQEWTISATENAMYNGGGAGTEEPVYCWQTKATIPTS